jgi:hypothetical protein
MRNKLLFHMKKAHQQIAAVSMALFGLEVLP